MLTEVMRQYRLARPPVDVGFFETEHHAQVARDLRAAIQGGRLIALTAVIGSGKTMLSRRLRDEIEREGRVIVARALTLEKAKITVPLLIAALFYDLSTEKTVSISSQSERRERVLQERFRKARKPVALFVDDAHDLHPKTLTALKRLVELVVEGGGQLSVVLIGHPKLKNDLRRPKMEEIGDRMTVFEFGGLRDRQRDYIDWALKNSLEQGVEPAERVTKDVWLELLDQRLAVSGEIAPSAARHRERVGRTGPDGGQALADDLAVGQGEAHGALRLECRSLDSDDDAVAAILAHSATVAGELLVEDDAVPLAEPLFAQIEGGLLHRLGHHPDDLRAILVALALAARKRHGRCGHAHRQGDEGGHDELPGYVFPPIGTFARTEGRAYMASEQLYVIHFT